MKDILKMRETQLAISIVVLIALVGLHATGRPH